MSKIREPTKITVKFTLYLIINTVIKSATYLERKKVNYKNILKDLIII